MLKIAIITNVIPTYRRDFYRRLLNQEAFNISIYCQSHIPGLNLKPIQSEFSEQVTEIPFWSMPKEKFAWQFLPVLMLWKNYDVYVFNGNPRVISNLVWASLFRMLGKKVVIWGQVHSAGASHLTEKLRLLWWRMFKNILVYNDGEVEKLRGIGFGDRVIVGMNNGLNQTEIDQIASQWNEERLHQWLREKRLEGKSIMLSCTRIEERNRFDLFLKCMPTLIKSNPELIWCVIGDGPAENELKLLSKKLGICNHVRWVGRIYDEDKLAPWFLSSKAFIQPEVIGLSMLHASGYGLPVITNDDVENHGPEVTVLKEGVNGLLYQSGSTRSLAEKVVELLKNEEMRCRLSENALITARSDYNTQIMAERFSQLIQRVVTH